MKRNKSSIQKTTRSRKELANRNSRFCYKKPATMSTFRFKGDEFTIRVVPYTATKKELLGEITIDEGDLVPFTTYYAHKNIGPSKKVVYCLNRNGQGKDCPICALSHKLYDEGDEELAKDYSAKERVLMNVIDTNNTKAGVQLMDVSSYLFSPSKIEDAVSRDPDKYITYAACEDGFDLNCINADNGNFATLAKVIMLPSDIVLEDETLDEALSLDNCFITLTAEEIEAMIAGAVDEEDEVPPVQEEEPEKPKEEKPKSKPKEAEKPKEEFVEKKEEAEDEDDLPF